MVLLVLTVTICGLAVLQREIPDQLKLAWATVLGFYYGGKKANGGGGV